MSDDFISKINEYNKARMAWFRHFLLLASTLFGVLISLFDRSLNSPHENQCFVWAIGLLAGSILMIGIATYSYQEVLLRYLALHQKSIAQNETLEPYTILREKRIFVLCAQLGQACFVACLVALVMYVVG